MANVKNQPFFEKSDKTFQENWKSVAQSCTQYNCVNLNLFRFQYCFFNGHIQEMTTNSHVLKVSIMYKYIYDFDPSFRGFNSALD